MLYTKLYRDGNPDICLTTFVMDSIPGMIGGEVRPAVVVCPGGGYVHLSPREAENLAVLFNAHGFHAFVLEYSITKNPSYETVGKVLGKEPLMDASWALATIREHAEEWHLDPDRIAIMGSSAGGHLAAYLGTCWNDPEIVETLGIKEGANKPNACLLNYPVLISGEFAHQGSLNQLIGPGRPQEDYLSVSLDRYVGEHTPPCFLWHTMEDQAVPVQNSIIFSLALRKYGVPFELHVFEKGAHGLSTCQADVAGSPAGINPETGKWMELCITFLRRQFNMK